MKSKQRATGFGSQCPPDETFVKVYFLQQGSTAIEASRFLTYYRSKGWLKSDGRHIVNWKAAAWTWIYY